MTPYAVVVLLETRDDAVRAALLYLYNAQTVGEQQSSTTNALNGIGFNAYDAADLTPLARAVARRQPLTDAGLRLARARLRKYARQIADGRALNHIQEELDHQITADPFAAVDLAVAESTVRRRAQRR